MKYPRYLDYSAEGTKRCEAGLLTIWAILKDFRDDLVLVGGLVPRYLCKPSMRGLQPVTMDVDLGIAIGTDSGQYDPVSVRLKNAGFVPMPAGPGHEKNRLTKNMDDGATLILDLLTDKPTSKSFDTVQVEGLWVNAFLGVGRALQVFREIRIVGHDLLAAKVVENIKVTEIGPFLCLKLNGYAGRAESKDVFDIVYSVKNYDRGPDEAARLFREEAGINPAFEPAHHILKERFITVRSKGPVQYADFCTIGQTGVEAKEERDRLANEAVDVAIKLLER